MYSYSRAEGEPRSGTLWLGGPCFVFFFIRAKTTWSDFRKCDGRMPYKIKIGFGGRVNGRPTDV